MFALAVAHRILPLIYVIWKKAKGYSFDETHFIICKEILQRCMV